MSKFATRITIDCVLSDGTTHSAGGTLSCMIEHILETTNRTFPESGTELESVGMIRMEDAPPMSLTEEEFGKLKGMLVDDNE